MGPMSHSYIIYFGSCAMDNWEDDYVAAKKMVEDNADIGRDERSLTAALNDILSKKGDQSKVIHSKQKLFAGRLLLEDFCPLTMEIKSRRQTDRYLEWERSLQQDMISQERERGGPQTTKTKQMRKHEHQTEKQRKAMEELEMLS